MSFQTVETDICIYGDSPSAVTAAISARTHGANVCLVVPGMHIGGILVEGLGSQDVDNHGFRNSEAIKGLALSFFQRIGKHYGQDISWKFESKVAEAVINEWLEEAEVRVYRAHRLKESPHAVHKNGERITDISTENGVTFSARVFIDGTVEGDLMKWAGISYTWGREGNNAYHETLNGIRQNSPYRNFEIKIDPYNEPGNPQSGTIPTVQNEPLGDPGGADKRIMAYCFRSCLCNLEQNRIPFRKPIDYDDSQYEIYRRYFKAGGVLFTPQEKLPNGKTDLGSWHDLSGNLYGENHNYPDGSYATRQRIYDEHKKFIEGLYWFLSNDPAVPSSQRNEWQRWGLAADEFTDNGGWPRMLYIRSGRRMISDYVVTEADVTGVRKAHDPVALAYWPPDMHHVRRIIRDGAITNEGFVFGTDINWKPFGISYRAITPKQSECDNLLVPSALSASYVAYGSIRLEWTFMMLGEAAGRAATLALEKDCPVQQARPALD